MENSIINLKGSFVLIMLKRTLVFSPLGNLVSDRNFALRLPQEVT